MLNLSKLLPPKLDFSVLLGFELNNPVKRFTSVIKLFLEEIKDLLVQEIKS